MQILCSVWQGAGQRHQKSYCAFSHSNAYLWLNCSKVFSDEGVVSGKKLGTAYLSLLVLDIK